MKKAIARRWRRLRLLLGDCAEPSTRATPMKIIGFSRILKALEAKGFFVLPGFTPKRHRFSRRLLISGS